MHKDVTIKCSKFQYSTHAVRRMLEKGISFFEVEQCIVTGEIIKDYEDDRPYPSKLLLNFIANRPIHVVVAQNPTTEECIIVTCYEPDISIWTIDFRTKR